MRAYKWMTADKRAFYDGYQFKFGWNEQKGEKNGLVCTAGGFHLTKDPKKAWIAQGSKYVPFGDIVCACYEVYYRKKDILGEDSDGKIRVSAFKLLTKKPVSKNNLVSESYCISQNISTNTITTGSDSCTYKLNVTMTSTTTG